MTYRDQQRSADIASAISAIRSHRERSDLSDGWIVDAAPADDIVLAALAEQVRRCPRQDGLVFSSSRRPLTTAIAGHLFDQIERGVGFRVSPHSLRHHFGASVAPQVHTVCTDKGAQ